MFGLSLKFCLVEAYKHSEWSVDYRPSFKLTFSGLPPLEIQRMKSFAQIMEYSLELIT